MSKASSWGLGYQEMHCSHHFSPGRLHSAAAFQTPLQLPPRVALSEFTWAMRRLQAIANDALCIGSLFTQLSVMWVAVLSERWNPGLNICLLLPSLPRQVPPRQNPGFPSLPRGICEFSSPAGQAHVNWFVIESSSFSNSTVLADACNTYAQSTKPMDEEQTADNQEPGVYLSSLA